jgi:hypothetical protein
MQRGRRAKEGKGGKTMEGKVNWKEPVDLSRIESGFNPLAHELMVLECYDFEIIRGPAGFGKTWDAYLWAKQAGYDAYVQECSSEHGYFDLVGSWLLDGEGAVYQAGVVASAMKHAQDGNKTLLIMDEINLLTQPTMKAIDSVFDHRKSVETPIGRLYGNGNLKVLGTCNSEQESAGFELDVSSVSRAVLWTLDAKQLADRFLEGGLCGKTDAKLMAETQGVYSLRESGQIMALAPKYGPEEAMRIVVNKYPNEEKKKLVREAVRLILGEPISRRILGSD